MIVDTVDKYCTDDNNPIKTYAWKAIPDAVNGSNFGKTSIGS